MLRRVKPISFSGDPENSDTLQLDDQVGPPGGIERRRHPRVTLDTSEPAQAASPDSDPKQSEQKQSDRRQGDRRQADRRSFDSMRSEVNWKVTPEAGNKFTRRSRSGPFGLTPSRLALLVVALLSGCMAAFLAIQSTAQDTISVAETAPVIEIAREARVQILVAKQVIGFGQRLSAQSVGWEEWPEESVRSDYITFAADPEALTGMSGTVARFEIFPGEPIRTQKLVRSDYGYLSAVLDSGMRAVSVSVSAISASGGFISPNDHVDVVLTRPSMPNSIPQTILHNVRVLAINSRLGEIGATGAPDFPDDQRAEVFTNQAIATLELGATEAEVIIGSATIGQISLVLRSITDLAERDEIAHLGANEAIRISSPFWNQTGQQNRPR